MREIGSAALSAVRRDLGGMCGGGDHKVDAVDREEARKDGWSGHSGNGYFKNIIFGKYT